MSTLAYILNYSLRVFATRIHLAVCVTRGYLFTRRQ